MELLGAFCTGFFLTLFLFGSAVSRDEKKIKKLKKENNKLKALGGLHIGRVVYACNKNSLYIGEITKIIHSERRIIITLNNDEDFSISDIYITKDDALKQLEI